MFMSRILKLVSLILRVYAKSHHTAVSAHIAQRQSKLSGPARVHAKLETQSLAARSWEAQGPDAGMAHRNPD